MAKTELGEDAGEPSLQVPGKGRPEVGPKRLILNWNFWESGEGSMVSAISGMGRKGDRPHRNTLILPFLESN